MRSVLFLIICKRKIAAHFWCFHFATFRLMGSERLTIMVAKCERMASFSLLLPLLRPNKWPRISLLSVWLSDETLDQVTRVIFLTFYTRFILGILLTINSTFKINIDKTWHIEPFIWFAYELYILTIFVKNVDNYIISNAWTALSSQFIINAESLKRVEVRCEHVVEGRHLHQFSVHSAVVRSRRTPWHDILFRPPRRHFQSLIFNPQNI